MSNENNCYIQLKRESQFVNRFKKFKVIVDKKEMSKISNGEEIIEPVKPGHHVVHVKVDWYQSEGYEFTLKKGEEIRLLCGSPIGGAKVFIPFIFLISVFRPKKYLFIKQEG
ncbi:hypothetical protein [Virgibacillus necropolis]|uniref:Uncharacterized protein n=1 Tax=Virgibacillus necropolis TaxID=163877 RepID=A0A221MCN5_9BACI|nr:hypothetical protein [Virgibacillus necropolis]ASN05401.1 hypothetical protein CFK40_10455 [Virgibacillus necropolis]